MRIAILTPKGFELREQDVPACADDQVLIKTITCGVCEGDLFTYRSVMGAADGAETTMGHEGTGVVAAVGERVRGFAEGDTVTSLYGAYPDYWVSPPELLLRVPGNIDPVMAMGEPVACCVHAANRFGIHLGDRVALVGCGFMGLTCLQLARLQGAATVVAFEPIAWRRKQALALGADIAVDPTDQSVEDLLRVYGAFDVVLEATGVQPAVDLCGELVRQHGHIVFIGYHQTNGGMRTVNMKMWNFKAIDVVNGHVRRDDEKLVAMRQGLNLIAAGRLSVAPLVTAYPFDRIGQAFQDLDQRKEGLYKVALVML